jgi:poly-gamma-glutamate synthase PgsB/CapB
LEGSVRELAVVGSALAVAILAFSIEAFFVRFFRRAVPTRVAVMGMRGKSSVVRLVAAGLRGGGHRVLYKTTGSYPIVGHPNGDERHVGRRSIPSPLEQRRILYLAKRLKADAAVFEAMSIRAESLRAEVEKILAPQIVAITSFRPDHLIDLPDPIGALAEAVPRGAIVICPPDIPGELCRRLMEREIPVHAVDPDTCSQYLSSLPYQEWPINLALALEICDRLGVPPKSALDGMRSVTPDVGALSAWRVDSPLGTWHVVNGFAANDPVSTRLVLERALERWDRPDGCRVGLLNLREDRGDRTEQWTSTLSRETWPFDCLAVVGVVPRSVNRQLSRALGERLLIVRSTDPRRILSEIASNHPEGGLLFGFGNMGGAGIRLVEWWSQEGEPA